MGIQGGDKLAKALQEIADKMQGGAVIVGFMPDSRYPDSEVTAAMAAFWNEFGTSKIPPRPFFRTTITEKSGEWADKLGKAAKFYGYNSEKVLAFMGEAMQQDVQSSINGWQDPANAESTVAKKGFNAPLRDTMHMHNSVAYEVEK